MTDHPEARDTEWHNESKGAGAPAAASTAAPAATTDTASLRRIGVKLVETAFRGSTRNAENDVFDPSNFEQVKNSWWIDRLMPNGVGRYLLAVFGICTLVWLVALLLRLVALDFNNAGSEFWNFVKDRQWQIQPLLLFVHFICLRLFKGIYSRNFERAFRYLDVRKDELEGYKKWFLGARVNLFALAVAAPFIGMEIWQFASDPDFYETVFGADASYVQMVDRGGRNIEAWYLLIIWTFEWLMFGYYCYLMTCGAVVVRGVMKKHDFNDSVDLVLTERQYRPLFNVVAQAGSLVFFYALFQTAYVVYTHIGWVDAVGLGLMVVLLCAAFGITWSAVRAELKGNVTAALEELEKSYRVARAKLATMTDVPGIEDDIQRIQVQLKMQLALTQLDYLQNKYESLGRKEFLGLVFKMLAPVGSVLARVIRWGSLLAAIGFGGAAAITGAVDKAKQQNVESRQETQQEAPAGNR